MAGNRAETPHHWGGFELIVPHFKPANCILQSTIYQQLESYVSRNNFPLAAWEQRGLNPSDDEIQEAMQAAITEFVRFLQESLTTAAPGGPELTAAVQGYLDNWDTDDFDTEERDFLYDVACEIMRVVQVNPQDISV